MPLSQQNCCAWHFLYPQQTPIDERERLELATVFEPTELSETVEDDFNLLKGVNLLHSSGIHLQVFKRGQGKTDTMSKPRQLSNIMSVPTERVLGQFPYPSHQHWIFHIRNIHQIESRHLALRNSFTSFTKLWRRHFSKKNEFSSLIILSSDSWSVLFLISIMASRARKLLYHRAKD